MPAFMGAAYQKQSGKRRPPFLTRHVSLWMPKTLEDNITHAKTNNPNDGLLAKYNEQESQAHHEWVKTIERFILGIYDKLKEGDTEFPNPLAPTLTNFLVKSKGQENMLGLLWNFYHEDKSFRGEEPTKINGEFRHPTVSINGTWKSMPIEVTIELHSEYFTVSTAIDLGYKQRDAEGKPIPNRYLGATYEKVAGAFEKINKMAARRYLAAQQTLSVDNQKQDTEDMQEPYALLLRSSLGAHPNTVGIWKQLRTELFGPAVKASGDLEKLGRMFGDIRGVVMRRGAVQGNFIALHHPSAEEGMPPIPQLNDLISGQPFGGFKNDDAASRMDDIIRHVDALLPLMRADSFSQEKISDDVGYKKSELSFSTLFKERGFHISSIGLQNPDPKEENKRPTPITYITLMSRGETRELGHMVDIGNRLNTLRLAGMYDFGPMNKFSRDLHFSERQLNEMARNILNKLNDTDGTEDITTELLKISQSIAEANASVAGGASFRGERSAYYRAQFEKLSKLLEMGKVPGLQNFEEIVNYRIGPLYELIGQTKLRSERVAEIIKEINEVVQTDREIRTQQDTAKQSKRTNRFLLAADVFICLVAGPEYLKNTLPEAFGDEFMKGHFSDQTVFVRGIYAVGLVMASRDLIIDGFKLAGENTLKGLKKLIVATPADSQKIFSLEMELLSIDFDYTNSRPQADVAQQRQSPNNRQPN